MNELVARWSAEHAVNRDDDLVREFEAHLSECSSLVVRVAYSVRPKHNPTPKTWRRRRSFAPTGACAAFGIERSSARGSSE